MNRLLLTGWALRILVALVLVPMAAGKFVEGAQTSALFAQIDMEPGGRYVVGVIEILAAGLLLIPGLAAWGAILAWGVMSGALIAHATTLGMGDPVPFLGVPLGVLAMVNWLATSTIIVIHRRDIGFIRDMSPERDSSERKP
jgi:uncharacterized membrane protein YphA (DoxX/SURF4 family)